MAGEKGIIKIQSILGGQSNMFGFAREDQFTNSFGIDPSLPLKNAYGIGITRASSGWIRPTGSSDFTAGTLHNAPIWMVTNPKNSLLYVYDVAGSVYSSSSGSGALTGLGDLNDDMTATGNGCSYYDNYIYFSTNTTVARYGPLDGTPAFTDNYWNSTLAKARLSDNSNYPQEVQTNYVLQYPNHVLHRHSDGRLYIADTVDNQGALHFIQTRKTTVEGDTDAGSTFGALYFGYGLYPTAMESYGSNLAIALYEGSGANYPQSKAKLAFWDTTSRNFNSITWSEFPDPYISAMKNVNGTLYIASGRVGYYGFRLSRYLGGNTFEEVARFNYGNMPFPGGMDAVGNQLVFGSCEENPARSGCVYSYGLNNLEIKDGIFNIHKISSIQASAIAISVNALGGSQNMQLLPIRVGWSTGENGATSNNGIDSQGYYNVAGNYWESQVYTIGKPFRITKITIPLAEPLTATSPTIYFDIKFDSSNLTTNPTHNRDIKNISYTNDGEKMIIVRRSEDSSSSYRGLVGQHNFRLAFQWGTDGGDTDIVTIALPITIEYELLEDEG